jgi:hypothetical protein
VGQTIVVCGLSGAHQQAGRTEPSRQPHRRIATALVLAAALWMLAPMVGKKGTEVITQKKAVKLN